MSMALWEQLFFVEVFRAIGIDVDFIIPDRLNDGYGISRKHIDEAKNLGGEVIITVDNFML